MCCCHRWTVEEEQEIARMERYAVGLLKGSTPKEVAEENGVTVDELMLVIEGINKINPPAYMQVMDKINEMK